MANKTYASLPEEELRELFLIGDRNDTTSTATWKLLTTPDSVQIVPEEISWWGAVWLNLIFMSLAGSGALVVAVYGDPEAKLPGAIVFLLVGAVTGAFGTYMGWRDLQRQQRLGPWLLIDRDTRTVTIPRQGITAALEAVDHIQAITGSSYGKRCWLSEDGGVSELNIIVREGGQRTRYPIISTSGDAVFTQMARTIANLDLMPVKRVQSNWEPLQIYETWMPPRRGYEQVN